MSGNKKSPPPYSTQFPVMGGHPPWHLWGMSKTLSVLPTAAATFQTASDQLLKINYKRPETWAFFFGAQIGGPTQTIGPVRVNVFIDIIFGLGRTFFSTEQPAMLAAPGALPRFIHFAFDTPPGTNLNTRDKKWTSVSSPVLLDDTDTTSGTRSEWIVGQDFQVQARMTVVAAAAQLTPVTATVTGFMSPRSHVRPDWFAEGGPGTKFLGNEVKGQ